MKQKWIFIQQNDLSEVNYGSIKKYQQFSVFLTYATLFVLSYLTIHFFSNNVSSIVGSKKSIVSNVADFIFQIIHTGFASYFLSLCFARFYHNHKSFKYYLVWMVIYYSSGIISFGLWFQFQKLIVFETNDWIDLIFFRYVVYFLLYAVLLEIIYAIYFIKVNAKVEPLKILNYKVKIFNLVVFSIYVLILLILFSGNLDQTIIFVNEKLVPFFLLEDFNVANILRNVFIIFIAIIPILFLFGLNINLKKYANP
ncbi:hypothetical protein MCAV_01870 [[Mycoplasma] cavipharyngis]|uniref:hypothetical protein n=1 Tax=[Mycoplasma] cavipharyngis TaxID=92757 RepID=UPI00370416E8